MFISRGLVNLIIVYIWRRILCSLEKIEIDLGYIINLKGKMVCVECMFLF